MKVLLTILLLFTLVSCKDELENKEVKILGRFAYIKDIPFTGQYIKTSTNGSISFVFNFKNGVKDGKQIGFYKEGQKRFESFYARGLKDGPYKEWYKNGQLYKEQVNIKGREISMKVFQINLKNY
ncbi:hypothetical protein A9Q84_16260 [Halobacteriovorax marinus]|uniref:Lipoprotein n=1 Tax=Halobacteriovorax marinus TaxID=97084 RepID=A0A1Y5F490_9BACT|nr:hypothetical protein A9Q84_16260 [Halobacteriovorax marinus]